MWRTAHAKSDSLERPLQPSPQYRSQFRALARALLYTEQTEQAHAEVLGRWFESRPARRQIAALAVRRLDWTAARPQPRVELLVRRLRADKGLKRLLAKHKPTHSSQGEVSPRMRPLPGAGPLVKLATVGALADWLRVEVEQLLWFADLKNLNGNLKDASGALLLRHYTTHVVCKPGGALRPD